MACCKPFDTSAEAGVAAHLTGSLSINLPALSTRVDAIDPVGGGIRCERNGR